MMSDLFHQMIETRQKLERIGPHRWFWMMKWWYCCCFWRAHYFHYEASKMSNESDYGHTSIYILANKERVKSQNITQTRMARICIWMFCLIVNVITQHIRRNIWNRHKNQNFLEEARERYWKCFLAIHDSWIICQFQRRNIFIENCFYDEAIEKCAPSSSSDILYPLTIYGIVHVLKSSENIFGSLSPPCQYALTW